MDIRPEDKASVQEQKWGLQKQFTTWQFSLARIFGNIMTSVTQLSVVISSGKSLKSTVKKRIHTEILHLFTSDLDV